MFIRRQRYRGPVLYEDDIFEVVRDIPIRDILLRYSPTEAVYRAGKIWLNCPFHNDKHPSLSAKGRRWRCFSCGEWGDGVDYVAKLFELESLAAARQIASDFGIVINCALNDDQRKAIAAAKRARYKMKVFKEMVERTYLQMCDVRIECCRIIDAAGVYGLHFSHVPYVIDTYLDVLQFGTDVEKRDFLKKGVHRHWLNTLKITETP